MNCFGMCIHVCIYIYEYISHIYLRNLGITEDNRIIEDLDTSEMIRTVI